MLKSETRSIGGNEYTVTQLGAARGREILRRIMKVAGPAMEAAARVVATGESGGKATAIVRGLGKVVETLSEEDLSLFCSEFGRASTVRLGGKSPSVGDVFEVHFAGNYLEMCEWLAFCLEVNYRSFFTGIVAKLGGEAQPQSPA
jgi:hypothetical protein